MVLRAGESQVMRKILCYCVSESQEAREMLFVGESQMARAMLRVGDSQVMREISCCRAGESQMAREMS